MKKRYFFDHIAKTGGISIIEIITAILGKQGVSPHLNGTSHREAILRYSDYDLISGHTTFLPLEQLDDSRFYFTMLRDPLDRLISQYWFQRLDMNGVHRSHILYAKNLRFEEYIRLDVPEVIDAISNVQTKHFAQLAWDGVEVLTSERMLELAKASLERFDLVGVYHRFDTFVDLLCFECAWPVVDKIPRVNITSSRKSVEQMNAENNAKLIELNRLDLELYAFASEEFEKCIHNVLKKAVYMKHEETASGGKLLTTESLNSTTSQDSVPSGQKEWPYYYFTEYGDRRIEIAEVSINGEISQGPSVIIGENVHVVINFISYSQQSNVTVGMQIFDSTGQVVFLTDSRCYGKDISIAGEGEYFARFTFRNDLGIGRYIIGAYIHKGTSPIEGCFHWKDNAASFEVLSNIGFHFEGRYKLYPALEIGTAHNADKLIIMDNPDKIMAVQRLTVHNPCLIEFSGRIAPVRKIPCLNTNEIIAIEVEVTNNSGERWNAAGLCPVCLSYHWKSASGDMLVFDGLRTMLPRSIAPGESVKHFMTVKAPDFVGNAILQLTLLQEQVAWFDKSGCPSFDIQIEISMDGPYLPQ